MGIATYTDFRARLAGYMEKVCDDRDVLYVTRHNARTVVVLSEEEYEGLIETAHLLKSPGQLLAAAPFNCRRRRQQTDGA